MRLVITCIAGLTPLMLGNILLRQREAAAQNLVFESDWVAGGTKQSLVRS